MVIQLQNFIPFPLAEQFAGESDLWRKDIVVLNSKAINLIVSSSGKGKSSLISSIYGLRKDYEGSITFDGKNVKDHSISELTFIRERKLSIVFQNLMLFPELTALDNILVKNQLTNYKSQNDILDLFEQLEMLEFIHQQASTLSFGQQQRVAIIRALCQPFEVLLLDEPFSHLDIQNSLKAWELINMECQAQKASIIITALNTDDVISTSQMFRI